MEIITKVFKSGNSQAIRIPKECRLDTDMAKITVKGNYLIVEPVKKVREGWEKAFKNMRKNNDDSLLIDDVFEDDIDV